MISATQPDVAVYAARIRAELPPGWTVTSQPDAITITRDKPTALQRVGIHPWDYGPIQPVPYSIQLRLAPRLGPEELARLADENDQASRRMARLEVRMIPFWSGTGKDYRPRNAAEQALWDEYLKSKASIRRLPSLLTPDASVYVTDVLEPGGDPTMEGFAWLYEQETNRELVGKLERVGQFVRTAIYPKPPVTSKPIEDAEAIRRLIGALKETLPPGWTVARADKVDVVRPWRWPLGYGNCISIEPGGGGRLVCSCFHWQASCPVPPRTTQPDSLPTEPTGMRLWIMDHAYDLTVLVPASSESSLRARPITMWRQRPVLFWSEPGVQLASRPRGGPGGVAGDGPAGRRRQTAPADVGRRGRHARAC